MTTDELVDEFATALKLRLRLRTRQGKDGWQNDWWKSECLQKMIDSAEDHDPLDTAGYAAFAFWHGWGKL
jgi:hypothetical protein